MNDEMAAPPKELQRPAEAGRRRFLVDGPPLAAVVVVFTLLEVVSFGLGSPVVGALVLAVGLVAALASDFATWTAREGGSRRDRIRWQRDGRMKRRVGRW